jgi:hypothetical protein
MSSCDMELIRDLERLQDEIDRLKCENTKLVNIVWEVLNKYSTEVMNRVR